MQWVAQMVQALALSAAGKVEEAQAMRAEALEAADAVPGTLTMASSTDETADAPFEWLADADSRIGPIFEAIVNGKYYWVPITAIASVEFDAPSDLRDMVWMPATFQWRNEGAAVALVPTRYAGSAEAADPALQLARKTEWQDAGSDEYRGLGQRVFATDGGEFGLCDVRKIAFTVDGE